MIKMVCRALKMITRVNRSSFMLLHRMKRMPLWLLMVCTLMGPEYATADECKSLTGSIRLQLPPSVSFPPGGHPDASESNPVLLFTGSTYSIQYECTNNTSSPRQVKLVRLQDFNPLLQALQAAGMKLTLDIEDSSGGGTVSWTPTLQTPEATPFGASYTGTVSNRTVRITPKLSLIKPPTTGFSVVPSLTAFEIISGLKNGPARFDGPQITTSAVRIQYVPTCFVRTSLGTNNVNFGPVLTTDADNSFSRNIPFNITADVNENCGKGNLQGTYNGYYLELPLKVSFILNNGGRVATDRKSILLYTDKDDKQLKNGLQLKINAPDGNPVTFNEASLPVNQFGDFHGGEGGGTWRVSNTYKAVLSSTGDPVITGKYSAQVTVKVDYY